MRWSPEMCANLIPALAVHFCHTGQFSYCWEKFSRSSDFLQLLQGKIDCIDFFKVCIGETPFSWSYPWIFFQRKMFLFFPRLRGSEGS